MTTVMNRREFTSALAVIAAAPGLILKEEIEPDHSHGEEIVNREATGGVVMDKARLFMPGDESIGLLADAVNLSYTQPYQLIKGDPYNPGSWYYSFGSPIGKLLFKHVVASHAVWQHFLRIYRAFDNINNKSDLRVESTGVRQAWRYRCSDVLISNLSDWRRSGDMVVVDDVSVVFEKIFTGSDF